MPWWATSCCITWMYQMPWWVTACSMMHNCVKLYETIACCKTTGINQLHSLLHAMTDGWLMCPIAHRQCSAGHEVMHNWTRKVPLTAYDSPMTWRAHCPTRHHESWWQSVTQHRLPFAAWRSALPAEQPCDLPAQRESQQCLQEEAGRSIDWVWNLTSSSSAELDWLRTDPSTVPYPTTY